MNAYEQAIIAHNESNQNNTFPIVSLEFYSDSFVSIKQNCFDRLRLKKLAAYNEWQNFNYNLLDKLQQVVIIVTTPRLEIIFASNQLSKMNGYIESEIIGKTPKIFQGVNTCPMISKEIRQAINLQIPFEQTIINYKKDGTPYNCLILGMPIFNKKGSLSHFVAFEKSI